MSAVEVPFYHLLQTLRLRKVNCDLHLARNVAVNQRQFLSCFINLINANNCRVYTQMQVFS